MSNRRGRRYRLGVLIVGLVFLVGRSADAADLDAKTLAAYQEYVAELEARFAQQIDGEPFLATDIASFRQGRDRDESVIVESGSGDGILDVHDGLIHHWRGAIFIADATLDQVLAVARDYPAYPDIYPGVIGARVFEPADRGRSDRYRVLLRVQHDAGGQHAVLDLWRDIRYRYPRSDRAAAISAAHCIRQVENAGQRGEYLLPPGSGSGYLWRAHTLAKYLAKDGGVYVELENVGLSRDFPALLGWVIEPFARRLGRHSVERGLVHLRTAVRTRTSNRSDGRERRSANEDLPHFWCTT